MFDPPFDALSARRGVRRAGDDRPDRTPSAAFRPSGSVRPSGRTRWARISSASAAC